jgi:hypothetical protein
MQRAFSSENEKKQSIWRQTEEGDWKLFFNVSEDSISKAESESHIKTIFDMAGKKGLKMGSLVMTPGGIGRLIRLDNRKATVKFMKEDREEVFDEAVVKSEFPVYLRILDRDFSNWYRVVVPANGSMETLKKLIEEIQIIDSNTSNYILIHNGVEIKDEFFFDQMDLRVNAKLLLCGLKMTHSKLNRFNTTYNWWYTYNTDGITFSVNKRIKLAGVGLYGSHESKVQNGTLKIFEGTVTSMGSLLYEDAVEVSAAPDQNNSVIPINFKKPVNLKPHIDYTIQLLCTNYCYLYYGGGGKATIEAERGVEFYFKYTLGSSHGSGIESGNFPEFYYYS